MHNNNYVISHDKSVLGEWIRYFGFIRSDKITVDLSQNQLLCKSKKKIGYKNFMLKLE